MLDTESSMSNTGTREKSGQSVVYEINMTISQASLKDTKSTESKYGYDILAFTFFNFRNLFGLDRM